MKPSSFSDIVITGLAPDGGLIIPEKLPFYSTEDLKKIRNLSYPDLALEILTQFADDIPKDDLKILIKKTYTEKAFKTKDITPLVELGIKEVYLLDLSNGLTLAFKDVALQLLGNLFEYILNKRNSFMNILCATSGDTGSAAIYGVRGKNRMNIFILTPFGRMSPFQTAQMYSVTDKNVYNIAVNGVFDDCQDMMKYVDKDKEFKAKYKIGAVNSTNWARIAAQIVYYFKGYFDLINRKQQETDYKIDFAVPTGNFGNILAGYYAKEMGLPISRLILATNENNVLDEFFKTGSYQVRKTEDIVPTSSPSMDISKASNFERFLYDIVNQDPKVVKELMDLVKNKGGFNLCKLPCFGRIKESGVVSGTSTEEDRANTIREIYNKTDKKIIIDTHTADGIKVGLDYKQPPIPLICLGTAKPVKFRDFIEKTIGIELPIPKGYKGLEQKTQRYKKMEKDIDALKKFIAENALIL